jgi:hypothetical protein
MRREVRVRPQRRPTIDAVRFARALVALAAAQKTAMEPKPEGSPTGKPVKTRTAE